MDGSAFCECWAWAGAALLEGVFGLFLPWVWLGYEAGMGLRECLAGTGTVRGMAVWPVLAGLAVMDRRAYSTTMYERYCVYFGPVLSGACFGAKGGEYPMPLSSPPSGLDACVQYLLYQWYYRTVVEGQHDVSL
jgi:hypothetical protein